MKRYIRSSDDYDMMHGSRYKVEGGPAGDYVGDYDENLAEYVRQEPFKTVYTDDPREAINAWFIAEEKYPADAAIMTNKPEYEMALCRWVVENEPEFKQMYNSHNCPYEYSWLIKTAKYYTNRAGGFYEYGYPDQIAPFSYA